MGSAFEKPKKPFTYGLFTSAEAKPGETRILRRPDLVNKPLIPSDPQNIGTMLGSLENNIRKFPNKNFMGSRVYLKNGEYGEYKFKTNTETYKLSFNFLKGIEQLQFCPEIEIESGEKYKFFGIYSKNREEWLIAYLGCQMNSITIVTLYDTLGLPAIEFILHQTELTSTLIESKSLEKIIKLKKEDKLSKLKHLVVLHCDNEENITPLVDECKELGLNIYFFDDIISIGAKSSKKHEEFKKSTPDTILTICYTSGTTGNPKGAMIPNNALLSALNSIDTIGEELGVKDSYLSYLPLAHIMEQLIISACIYFGCEIGFYSGDIRQLAKDCKALRPTFFCGVPRVFLRFHEVIMNNINSLKSQFAKRIALKAIETKLDNYAKYGILTHAIYDPLVFKKIQNVFGGRLRWMLVGSAPMQSEILKSLRVILSCPIVEGYGQTEDCAGVLLANVKDNSAGHLGGVEGCCECKLIDVPHLGYKVTDVNEKGESQPRGEICIRGSIVFKGYYKDEEKTKEAIDEDGWLHSGDVGVIMTNHGNAIRIIDRVKNIFKMNQGEYIASEKVENILSTSKYVNQIFIDGKGEFNYIIAIVVPEVEECIKFFNKSGVKVNEENFGEFINNEKLKTEILNDLDKVGRENDLKGFEIPKNIYLEKEPFTIENGLLTPTSKLKSQEIKEKYKQQIDEMY